MPSIIDPSGAQLKELEKALLKAYQQNSLRMMLHHRLGIRLEEEINVNTGTKYIVHDLVDLAIQGGWLEQLVRAARQENPGNVSLRAVSQQLGFEELRSPMPSAATETLAPGAQTLEKIVRERSPFQNFADFEQRLRRLGRQMCSIQIPNRQALGTGWLVGPDVVLTNYHVMESVHLKQISADDIQCRFDFLNDGTPGGLVCGLAQDWLIDHSPYSLKDLVGSSGDPASDELDYALVKVARGIGKEVIAVGEERGWIRVNARPPAVLAQDIVLIAQHPKGRPLELAMGVVFSYNGNATRVRYDVNTDEGSSGSPCFTTALEPFALHNAGGPSKKFQYNQGIPLRRVIEHMTAGNKTPFWS